MHRPFILIFLLFFSNLSATTVGVCYKSAYAKSIITKSRQMSLFLGIKVLHSTTAMILFLQYKYAVSAF